MQTLFTTLLAVLIFCATGFAQQHQLWVTTTVGGLDGWRGGIFTADSTGTNFHSVYDCDSNGSQIVGSLLMAPNGLLYGVTETGGYNDSCVICTYQPLTGVFTNIHDFVLAEDSGYGAKSGLTLAADGNLYGLAPEGGSYRYGVLYMIDPSDNSYHIKHHFLSAAGSSPYGGLLQLSNGKLYGMTAAGGDNAAGVIFSYDIATSAYTVLYHFDGTNGQTPFYTTLIKATNGKLYGMTQHGGLNQYGVIFSFDIAGNVYTKLHDFNDLDGKYPYGSLMQATNGKLYGLTKMGGTQQKGVLFSFNPVTNSYSKLLDFDGTNGSSPSRSLTQASSGKLFGTTLWGGATGNGVIFSFDIANNTYAKVYEFDGISGGSPDCEVYESVTSVASGIAAISKEVDINIYPNPASNAVTISVNEDMIGSTATITDITGRKMAAVQLSIINYQLSIKDFSNGVYFVTVASNEGKSATGKFVVSK